MIAIGSRADDEGRTHRGDRDESDDPHEGVGGSGLGRRVQHDPTTAAPSETGSAWQSVRRWTRRSSWVSGVSSRSGRRAARRAEALDTQGTVPAGAVESDPSSRRSRPPPGPSSLAGAARRRARSVRGGRDHRRIRDSRAVHDDRAGRSVVAAEPGVGRGCEELSRPTRRHPAPVRARGESRQPVALHPGSPRLRHRPREGHRGESRESHAVAVERRGTARDGRREVGGDCRSRSGPRGTGSTSRRDSSSAISLRECRRSTC